LAQTLLSIDIKKTKYKLNKNKIRRIL